MFFENARLRGGLVFWDSVESLDYICPTAYQMYTCGRQGEEEDQFSYDFSLWNWHKRSVYTHKQQYQIYPI